MEAEPLQVVAYAVLLLQRPRFGQAENVRALEDLSDSCLISRVCQPPADIEAGDA